MGDERGLLLVMRSMICPYCFSVSSFSRSRMRPSVSPRVPSSANTGTPPQWRIGITLAHVVLVMPYALRLVLASITGLPRDAEQAAETLAILTEATVRLTPLPTTTVLVVAGLAAFFADFVFPGTFFALFLTAMSEA